MIKLPVVLPATVFVTILMTSCHATPEQTNDAATGRSQAEQLLANKTRYIGDNSKDLALLGALR